MKYKFIETSIFNNKLIWISKRFNKVDLDWNNFIENFEITFWIHLWEWIYKFRIKNSSIPTWKSWWFRVIYSSKIDFPYSPSLFGRGVGWGHKKLICVGYIKDLNNVWKKIVLSQNKSI